MKGKVTVNKEYPYLGLNPYTEEVKDYFYARENEVDILLKLVEKNITTVLFGKSGLGKTSLVQAGLIPLLRKNYYLPIIIRINFGDSYNSPLLQLKRIIDKQIRKIDDTVIPINNFSLWEYFHKVRILSGFVKPVLIFDQFEEIFSLGKQNQKQVNEFISEITNLVENQIPASIQEKYDEIEIPFSYEEQNFRVLLSLREDYLPQLENLNAFIPSLKKSRLRLLQLNRESAVEVVYQPAKKIISYEDAEKVVEMILAKTVPNYDKDEDNDEIWENYKLEPFLLNLICFQINDLRIQQYGSRITSDLLNKIDVERIIKNFYYQNTYDLNPETKKIIENNLLTHDGYRKLQHKNDLLLITQITENDIEKLIDRRILRNEIWNGREHLELIHDVLVPIVKESRDKRIEEEKRRKHEEELQKIREEEEAKRIADKKQYEEKHRLEREKSEQKARNSRRLATIISVGAIAILGFAIFAVLQMKAARKSEQIAMSNSLAANALLTSAKNPTLGFRLAERAFRTDPTVMAETALRVAYYSGSFFSIFDEQNNPVRDIDFTESGKSLVYTKDTMLEMQSLDGSRKILFAGHTGLVNSVEFSPNGRYILSASDDSTARLWNISGIELQQYKKHNHRVLFATFSPDGRQILTTSADNSVIIWSIDGEVIKVVDDFRRDVINADFSPDGNYFITADQARRIRLFDKEGNELRVFRDKAQTLFVRFTPDGQQIVTSSLDSCLRIWTLDGQVVEKISSYGVVSKFSFTKDNALLLPSSDKNVYKVNFNGELLQTFKGHSSTVNDAIETPNGVYIITASDDYTVRTWKQAKQEGVFMRFTKSLFHAVFSPDENYILTLKGNVPRLWDMQGNKVADFKGHDKFVIYADFSNNQQYIVTASIDNTARLWNINGDLLHVLRGHTNQVTYGAFSPNSEYVITTGWDSTAILWNLRGEELMRISGSESGNGMMYSAEFSPDGKYILTTGSERIASLWDLEGNKIRDFTGHRDIIIGGEFSPDGKYIITCSYDKTARVWNTNTGECLLVLSGHRSNVNMAKFSPDGKHLLTASKDRTVRLWDLKGNELFEYKGHEDEVYYAQFFKNGKYILSVSRDQTVRRWPVAAEEIIRLVNEDKVFGSPWELDENTKKRYQLLQ